MSGIRRAVLDLGTNSFHLLVAEDIEDETRIIYRDIQTVQLGREGLKDGLIHRDAIARALSILNSFSLICKKLEISTFRAMATSAIRDAVNGPDLLQQIKECCGFEVIPITGDREAELIWKAVSQGCPISDKALIMDIGGGSTEFIITSCEGILWKKSYSIGAARMMENFQLSDPLNLADQKTAHHYLDIVLTELRDVIREHSPLHLIGASGAFETIKSLCDPHYASKEFDCGIQDRNESNPSCLAIDILKYKRVAAELIKTTSSERYLNERIPEIRKEMIIMALIQVNYVMDLMCPEEFSLSVFALKEGALFDWLEEA